MNDHLEAAQTGNQLGEAVRAMAVAFDLVAGSGQRRRLRKNRSARSTVR